MENDDRPAFWRFAACRDADADWFFPDRGEDTRRAKAICAGCPVRDVCLEHNLHERFGIWGGLSGRERRSVRAQRRADAAMNAPAAAATVAGDGGHVPGSGTCPRPGDAHLRRVQ